MRQAVSLPNTRNMAGIRHGMGVAPHHDVLDLGGDDVILLEEGPHLQLVLVPADPLHAVREDHRRQQQRRVLERIIDKHHQTMSC